MACGFVGFVFFGFDGFGGVGGFCGVCFFCWGVIFSGFVFVGGCVLVGQDLFDLVGFWRGRRVSC